MADNKKCECGGYLWDLGDYYKCGDCQKVEAKK